MRASATIRFARRVTARLTAIALAVCAAMQFSAQAQTQTEAGTSTAILNPDFRTLKISIDGDFFAPAVLTPSSEHPLVISFDELTTDASYLQYSIYQCNADWQPSRLLEQEYLPGFNRGEVTDRAFSSNTFQRYVNYRITIPDEANNPDMMPTVSGNYLVQVYREFEPDDVVAQARFQISEEIAAISGEASPHNDRGIEGAQQLSLEIDFARNMRIDDPYSRVIVAVEQNGSPHSRRTTMRPLFVESDRLIYRNNSDLIFPAGNEFRRFETVMLREPGMHTDSVRHTSLLYDAYLTPDLRRADRQYLYDSTQRGRFLVRESNATDSDLGADYVTTHFTLDMPRVMNGDIYLDGEFTHHRLEPQYRMDYDESAMLYRLSLPLKQGSYNYRYVVAPREAAEGVKADPALVEGDFPETSNEYLVSVYLRLPGARYDRLIASGLILSKP